MNTRPWIYGIGNPLIDILIEVSDEDLKLLGLHKGTMHLIDKKQQKELMAWIEGREVTYRCGGSCPNTIITLASFGVPAALAGSVGSDPNGKKYRNALSEYRVIDALKDCSEPTGSSIILVSPDCERTMSTFLGANREFSPEDVDESLLNSSNVFHFTGYMWDTDNQKHAVLKALDISRAKGILVSFDIADPFAVSRNRESFYQIISKYADIVFANSEEARILFDNYDAAECAKKLGNLCDIAIVKNGKHGSYIARHGKVEHIPANKVDSVDTTGAGDIYAAGFLLGQYLGISHLECGTVASLLAGEIVKQQGAQFCLTSVQHIKQTLAAKGIFIRE